MILKVRQILYALLLCTIFVSTASAGSASQVRDVRLWTAPDHSRLVFDLNKSIKYQVLHLYKPERIVIDMSNTQLKSKLGHLKVPDPVIQSIRHGGSAGTLRIVLDVRESVTPRTFLLKPMKGKPYRLVVDLMRKQSAGKKVMTSKSKRSKKDVVIVIDAGHGGEDPGGLRAAAFLSRDARSRGSGGAGRRCVYWQRE